MSKERTEITEARNRDISDREKQSPMYLTLGEQGYRDHLARQARLKICMTCHRFAHDEDSQDVCNDGDECLLEVVDEHGQG